MKERELVALGKCAVCGKALLESPLPLFYIVEISRHGFDGAALRRRVGLEMMVGSGIAMALGPNEDLTTEIAPPVKVAVHETCAGERYRCEVCGESFFLDYDDMR